MSVDLDKLFIYPKHWVDEDARSFSTTIRQWADKEIISDRLNYQQNYTLLFPEKCRKLGIDIGLKRLVLSEKYDGYGWNSPSYAPAILTAFTEIGRGDASIGLANALDYAIFATITMHPNIKDDLCDALAPLYLSDKLKTSTAILPGAGINDRKTPLFRGMSVLAGIAADDNEYVVSGENLRPFGFGKASDLLCVVCAQSSGKICLAFVPADISGVKKGLPIKQTGLDASENTDISFESVRIPKEYIISRDGAVEELYVWLNLLLGGVSIGAAMNFFEILTEWAQSRTIKGGIPMKENPLCASVLATVAQEITCARLLCYSLSQIMADPLALRGIGGESIYTIARMIGSSVQDSALNALNRGMELMGSAGYAREWHVEKHWRDIKTVQSSLCGVAADIPVKMDIARFFYDCKEVCS
ncbi:MAG: acyl-CoA/acyl-ACP dehydrogenase [Deltaproteobacteria bacterium]|nr:acyl-CoA/acyl-ACP dehydrogenase [Deltaproteobacteria bacterium]